VRQEDRGIEDQRLPCFPRSWRGTLACGGREYREITPLIGRETTGLCREAIVPNGDPGTLRRVDVEPGRGRRATLAEERLLAEREGTPLLRFHASRDVDTGDLHQERQVAERRPERRRLGGDVSVGIQERVAERRHEPRRQLAANLAARDGRGEPVVLVEQARDGIGTVRIEVDRLVRPWPQEQESQLRRRNHLDDLVGRRSAAFGCRHLASVDVQELVRYVARRFSLEDFPGNGIGPIARPAGGREVLAARLDRDGEQAPLCGPLQVQGQLGPPAEWRDLPGVAAAPRPRDEVGPAFVRDLQPVPARDDRRPDAPA